MDQTNKGGMNLVIVDDNEVVFHGIKSKLSGIRPDIQFNYYSSIKELKEKADKLPIKTILMIDVYFFGTSIEDLYDVYRHIYKRRKDIKIISMSSQFKPHIIKMLFKLGSRGFYIKTDEIIEILEGLNQIQRGERFLSSSLLMLDWKNEGKNEVESEISSREIEVISRIAEGLNNFEIAEKLFISVYTVQNHRQNILQKLNAKNTAELIRIAVSKGLINY